MFDIDEFLNKYDDAPPAQPPRRTRSQAAAQTKPLAQTKPRVEAKPRMQHSSAAADDNHSGTDYSRGTMSGVFGSRGDALSFAAEKPRPRRSVRQDTGERMRGFLYGLPEYWGVDLVLILATMIGIVAIILNWNAVLLAIARFILGLVQSVIPIAIPIVVILVIYLMLRRRRKY